MSIELTIAGNEETVKPILTLLMALNQLIENKDIGQFVGEPIEEHVTALPHKLRLKAVFYSVKEPPYKAPLGKKLKKTEINVPDVDPKKLDWTFIKMACGGTNGYNWGRYVATVNLDNGRQMQCYGSNAQEAENQLMRMMNLTTAKILTWGTTEIKRDFRRSPNEGLDMPATRVYPAWFTLINSKRINRVEYLARVQEQNTKMRSKLRGDYVEKGSEKILLWKDNQPSNYKQIIANALKFSDSSD